jgi:hypothetical protein
MRLVGRWTVAGAGLVATGFTFVVPWARYGDTGVGLNRFPLWWLYLAFAVALQAAVLWSLVRAGRRAGIAGAVLGVATVAVAVVVARRYDDATALFGSVVPMTTPSLGAGGPLAVIGAVGAIVAAAWGVPGGTRERAAVTASGR